MDNFYITLPSNVQGLTRENVLSDYVTHLPRTIELDNKYEVALVEFVFTKSWYNIEKATPIGIYSWRRLPENTFLASEKLLPGKYTKHQLVEEINKRINTLTGKVVNLPSLEIDESTNRIAVRLGEANDSQLVMPYIESEIASLLGLNNKETIDEFRALVNEGKEAIKGFVIANNVFDMEKGIYSIFVYSDIVEETIIGDKSARCLRVVAIPASNFGETLSVTFDEPHYLPVSKRSFNSIQVSLRDKTNEKIRFRFGETLVKLHFRKC